MTNTRRIARNAIPPTTPPTIAPVGVLDLLLPALAATVTVEPGGMVEDLVSATVTSCPLDWVTMEVTICVVMGVVTLLSVREGLGLGEAGGEFEGGCEAESDADGDGDGDGDADGDVEDGLEDESVESVGRPDKESGRDRLREAMVIVKGQFANDVTFSFRATSFSTCIM
jgi:hypothetical protein